MTIHADLHTHSLASHHAFSSLDELIRVATAKKLWGMALTNHSPGMTDGAHEWHFGGMWRLPREMYGVRFLSGVEVNVLDADGGLDLPERLLHQLDFVVASMHGPAMPSTTPEDHTRAWLAMCRNPLVDCLGHAGQPQYAFDIDTVVRACGETGTLIEINNATFSVRRSSVDNCRAIALACKRHGVSVVVTSDAHSLWEVGVFDDAVALLEGMDFPEELVMNASVERLETYFSRDKA